MVKKQEIDVVILQEQMLETKEFIKDMKVNHLPHLYDGINEIKRQQAYWAGGITVVVILAQIFIQKLI